MSVRIPTAVMYVIDKMLIITVSEVNLIQKTIMKGPALRMFF
jgi:hypothetical protein